MDAVTRQLTRICCSVSMILLACVTLLTTLDVLGRQFGYSITGAYQISELSLVWIILLSWPLTEATSGHVDMDIVASRLSKKTQRRVAYLGNCLTLAAFCVIVWQGVELVRRDFGLNEMIPIMDIPLYPFLVVIPVAAAINCLVLIAHLRQLFNKRASPPEERLPPTTTDAS
jgi:TRAP-type C4-dicarboxylate transport system permease small subunit